MSAAFVRASYPDVDLAPTSDARARAGLAPGAVCVYGGLFTRLGPRGSHARCHAAHQILSRRRTATIPAQDATGRLSQELRHADSGN